MDLSEVFSFGPRGEIADYQFVGDMTAESRADLRRQIPNLKRSLLEWKGRRAGRILGTMLTVLGPESDHESFKEELDTLYHSEDEVGTLLRSFPCDLIVFKAHGKPSWLESREPTA